MQLLQSRNKCFIKCSFILCYSAVTQGIRFSQGFFGTTVNDQQTQYSGSLSLKNNHWTNWTPSHMCTNLHGKVLIQTWTCVLYFPFLVYQERTCILICPKQCLFSGSNMLLLLQGKVNTRATKAGGVSEFLLGRKLSTQTAANEECIKEIPCCHRQT